MANILNSQKDVIGSYDDIKDVTICQNGYFGLFSLKIAYLTFSDPMRFNFDQHLIPYPIRNMARNTMVKLSNSQDKVILRYDVINDVKSVKMAIFGLFSLKSHILAPLTIFMAFLTHISCIII